MVLVHAEGAVRLLPGAHGLPEAHLHARKRPRHRAEHEHEQHQQARGVDDGGKKGACPEHREVHADIVLAAHAALDEYVARADAGEDPEEKKEERDDRADETEVHGLGLPVAAAVVLAALLVVAAAALVAVLMVTMAAAALVALLVVAAAAAAALLTAAAAAVGVGVQKRPVEPGRRGIALLGVQQRECLGAHARAADLAKRVEQGEGGLGAGQRELGLLGGAQRERDVLAQVLGHEAGLVIAVEGLGRKACGGAGAARTARHEVEDLVGVEVALLGERERVGIADHAGGEAHLVAELGGLAGAGGVEVEELLAEGLKKGQHGGGLLLGRADDQREGAGLGARLAACDGAVEGVLVLDLGGIVDVAGELRRARGEVDEVGALASGADEAVGGQVDVLDVGRVANHRKDDVSLAGGVGRGIRPLGAAGKKRLGLGLGAVVHGEVIARVEDVATDRGAHDAGADEGHLGVVRVAHSCLSLSRAGARPFLPVDSLVVDAEAAPPPAHGGTKGLSARQLLVADLAREPVGEAEVLATVLAPEDAGDHARAHVRADDRRDGAVDDGHVGAAGLLAKLVAEPLGVLLGVGGDDAHGHRHAAHIFLGEVVGLEVGDDGAQGLLAPAAHAAQREGAVEVVGELGLDVELAADRGGRGRDAAAAGQGVEVVEREVTLDVVAGLLCPLHKLLGGKAPASKAHGLDGKELGRGGRAEVVDHVELEARMALAHHVGRRASGVDGRREAAREAEVDGRGALLCSRLEDLEVVAGGDGRRRGDLAGAHALIEVVRAHGLPEVVEVLFFAHDEGEAHGLDAERAHDLGSEVGARVDDDVDVRLRMISAAQARSLLRRLGVGVAKLFALVGGLIAQRIPYSSFSSILGLIIPYPPFLRW